MDIREAIEKAGPGGKIRRKVGDEQHFLAVNIPKQESMYLTLEDGRDGVLRLDWLTATDWEVVQDEMIEVGDVVKYDENHREFTVMGISGKKVMVVYTDTISAPLESLTLIHKGPKVHTFEGVEVTYMERWTGTMIVVPHDCKLIDNGKTYSMELTEEVE